MGDVKLSGLIGFFVGFDCFLVALWLAAILGAAYGIMRIAMHASTASHKLPFGSFLAVTSVLVMFFQNTIRVIFAQWLTLLQ